MKKSNVKWNGQSRGGSFGYNFFVILIKICGIRGAYAFLSLVILYFIPCAPKSTAAIWNYNRKILRYGIIKSIFKLYVHYYTFGQTLIDKVAAGSGLVGKFRFEFENRSEFMRILESGGGVIMIGAHVGCWEMGSSFFGKYASRMNIIMYDNEYRKIKRILEKQCKERGYNIIPTNKSGIESLILMKKAIDRGDYLCFQGDRYVSQENTTKAVFMGYEAVFPKGPFVIAEKFNVPVIFYYASRKKGMKYRFSFTVLNDAGARKDIFGQYLVSLENIVRQYPQQWFNLYKFWQ